MMVLLLVLLHLDQHRGLWPVSEMNLGNLVAVCHPVISSQLRRCFDQRGGHALLSVRQQTRRLQVACYVIARLGYVDLIRATRATFLGERHARDGIVPCIVTLGLAALRLLSNLVHIEYLHERRHLPSCVDQRFRGRVLRVLLRARNMCRSFS